MQEQTSILLEADKIVNGDRDVQYNNPIVAFDDYSIILRVMYGITLKPSEICKVLLSVKLGREKYKHKRDNLTDTVGYLEILNQLLEHEARIILPTQTK